MLKRSNRQLRHDAHTSSWAAIRIHTTSSLPHNIQFAKYYFEWNAIFSMEIPRGDMARYKIGFNFETSLIYDFIV